MRAMKIEPRRIVSISFACLLLLLSVDVLAQRPTGTISGRILAEDGQPVASARIMLVGVGGKNRNIQGRAMMGTDDEGNFKYEGLDPIPYRLVVQAPGYVVQDQDAFRTKTYRIGEFAAITLVRGGVVTGRVLSPTGEPVVYVGVRALRIRDGNGKPIPPTADMVLFESRRTDDRGVYRIYGLAAGSYVVAAGGASYLYPPSPYIGKAASYHPSGARETAVEVTVRPGEETAGIDIRYRGESGYTISGTIQGEPAVVRLGAGLSTASVALRRVSTGELVSIATVSPTAADQRGFAFYGIPPGEYEARAIRDNPFDENPAISDTRKVTVTNADVSGMVLTLAAGASISGVFSIEETPGQPKPNCPGTREGLSEEAQIQAVLNRTGDRDESIGSLGDLFGWPGPDAKGAFALRNLRPEHYRIKVSLPSEGLYLKSFSFEKPDRQPPRDGIVLKAGERVEGLRIVAAHGAASFSGTARGRETGRRIAHLVPREPEAGDDVLRYYETPVENGEFHFAHLAPGKYWLLIRAEEKGTLAPATAWNGAERAALRKLAEKSGQPVELNRCGKK